MNVLAVMRHVHRSPTLVQWLSHCAALHSRGNYRGWRIGDKEMHRREMMLIRRSIDFPVSPPVGGKGDCLHDWSEPTDPPRPGDNTRLVALPAIDSK
jgi:hypothetical protein